MNRVLTQGRGAFSQLVLLLMLAPNAVSSQQHPVGLHFTLAGWADDTWLMLEDRDAAGEGRLSRAGILQRFHEKIDAEYELDELSRSFSPTEEFGWYNQANGFRWQGGSINRRELIDQADVRLSVSVGGTWTARVLVNNKNTPVLDRSTLRVSLRKHWASGMYVFAEGSLHEIKPSSDIGFGGGFTGRVFEGSAAVIVLDAFNGVVSQLLTESRFSPPLSLQHDTQPVALRAALAIRPNSHLRAELYAAALLPTKISAFLRSIPDSGFSQDERFGYIGVLGEWIPTPKFTAGVFGTYARASLDRQALLRGADTDNFRLVERTTELGAVLLTNPSSRWLIQQLITRSFRPELRDRRSDSLPNVDWEDRAWSGQTSVTYTSPSGFIAGTAFEWDLREVTRGNPDATGLAPDADGRLVGIGQVPSFEFLGRDQTRVRFDIGWQFLRGRKFAVGFRMDVDGDNYAGGNSRFDGAHGRFEFTW